MQHEIESQWADRDPTSELDRNRYSSNQSACCLWIPSWLGVTFLLIYRHSHQFKSTRADGTRRHRLHTPESPSLKAQTKKSNSRDAQWEAKDILEQQIHFQRFVFTPRSSTITTCSPQAGLAAQSARWLARFSGRSLVALDSRSPCPPSCLAKPSRPCAASLLIYFLSKGRIVEEASHSELMERRGEYYSMYIASNTGD